jgi:hypothetical protein
MQTVTVENKIMLPFELMYVIAFILLEFVGEEIQKSGEQLPQCQIIVRAKGFQLLVGKGDEATYITFWPKTFHTNLNGGDAYQY